MSCPEKLGTKHKKYDDWEIKSAHRTLVEAEEIKKNPKLMGLVKKHNQKEAKAIETIDDLYVRAKELEDEEAKES